MVKQHVGGFCHAWNNITDEEKEDQLDYESLCVRKFFEAECSHESGEMYSFKFSRKFMNESALFRADVLMDLSMHVQDLYEEALAEMHKEDAKYDRNQRRSNQLRGSESQPEAGQDGDHPDAGDTPK
jgi:hypothetical protein